MRTSKFTSSVFTMNSKGLVSAGTPVSPLARTLTRYSVSGANSGSARSTISRRLAKVARTFTAGVMLMLADGVGAHALLRHDVVGEQHAHRRVARDGAIAVLADRGHPLRIGRRGRAGGVATPVLPLQLTHRKAAAVASRAERKLRIMEAPEGGVDRRSFSSTQEAVEARAGIVANEDGNEGWRVPQRPHPHRVEFAFRRALR